MAQWLRSSRRSPSRLFRSDPAFLPCDFGVSSVLFWVSGFGFGSLFSLRPSGLPFPPPGVFPFGPFFGRGFCFFASFALASCIFSL